MKTKLLIALFIGLAVSMAAIVVSCGQTSSGGGGSTISLYTSMTSTTPVIKPISTSSSGLSRIAATDGTSWESGNPLYSVYFTVREFLHSRDEGIVDRSNLYKLLYDVDTVLSGLTGTAVAIATQEVTPPFASLEAVNCNKAYNDTTGQRAIAITETSAETNAIISWIWTTGASQKEYGIAKVLLNKTTYDITVDMVFSVDYNLSDTATDYNLRCQVTGNTSTHTFQYKYLIGNNAIVAKGISKGAGNYMLFKYKGLSNVVNYVVASAEASEAYFKAENTTPTNITTEANDLPASVSAYKTWVVATDFFTTAEALTNLNQLNVGNPKAGTIYINYQ